MADKYSAGGLVPSLSGIPIMRYREIAASPSHPVLTVHVTDDHVRLLKEMLQDRDCVSASYITDGSRYETVHLTCESEIVAEHINRQWKTGGLQSDRHWS
jgi:hypothetical protein